MPTNTTACRSRGKRIWYLPNLRATVFVGIRPTCGFCKQVPYTTTPAPSDPNSTVPAHRRAEQDARQRIVTARTVQTFEERLAQAEKDIDLVWWQNHRMWVYAVFLFFLCAYLRGLKSYKVELQNDHFRKLVTSY